MQLLHPLCDDIRSSVQAWLSGAQQEWLSSIHSSTLHWSEQHWLAALGECVMFLVAQLLCFPHSPLWQLPLHPRQHSNTCIAHARSNSKRLLTKARASPQRSLPHLVQRVDQLCADTLIEAPQHGLPANSNNTASVPRCNPTVTPSSLMPYDMWRMCCATGRVILPHACWLSTPAATICRPNPAHHHNDCKSLFPSCPAKRVHSH